MKESGDDMKESANELNEAAPQAVGVPAYESYIDKRECAKRLGRTVRSVDTYMDLGIIPYYKLGRTVKFLWSEVDAHIKAHYRAGVRR